VFQDGWCKIAMSDAHSAGTNLQRCIGPKEISRRILHFGLQYNTTDFGPREDTYPCRSANHEHRTSRTPARFRSSQHEYDQTARCITPNEEGTQQDETKSRTLTTQRFQGLLTLFSKFFASFHHCTCSLSVSGRYLALAEGYLPISSAFPN
jgi:hypothetical protein